MAAYTLGWKAEEPAPPLACTEDDLWLFPEDSVRTNISEPNNFGTLNKRQLAEQLLEDIDSILKNEENDTFSDWIEETIDLHLFDEIQPVVPAEESKSSTEDTVVDTAVEATDSTPSYNPGDTAGPCVGSNCDTIDPFVPPSESTPDCTYQTLTNFDFTSDGNLAEDQSSDGNLAEDQGSPDRTGPCGDTSQLSVIPTIPTPSTPGTDTNQEMELIEEIVRRTAQAIGSHHIVVWEFRMSNHHHHHHHHRHSASGVTADSDDSEWLPTTTRRKTRNARKKSKPYEKPKSQEDRMKRKKEQNKVAAVRYRQRKKAELSEMLKQEKMLEERRNRLKLRLVELQMEIKYMKAIMRDLFMSNIN